MKKINLFILTTISVLYGCQSNSNREDHSSENSDSTQVEIIQHTEEEKQRIDDLINSIGPPIEYMYIIKDLNLKFSPEILCSPESADNYRSSLDMGLAMGLLSADFVYCLIYQRNDLAEKYMKLIEQISTELNMNKVIDFDRLSELSETSANAGDLALEFTYQMENGYAHLKSQNQMDLSTMISFGSWIESMYIPIKTGKNSDQYIEEVIDVIYFETQMSQSFMEMFESYSDMPGNQEMLNSLTELKLLGEAFDVSLNKIEPMVNYSDTMTQVINLSTTTLKYDKNDLTKLMSKVVEIRNSVVK